MERISCSDKITDEDVLRKVNEDEQVLNAGYQNITGWVTFCDMMSRKLIRKNKGQANYRKDEITDAT